MKKLKIVALSVISLLLVVGCAQKKEEEHVHPKFDALERLTLAQLDEKIANEDTFTVYMGWTENCEDSSNFQDNYLEKKLGEEDNFKKIYVVDLDKEAPKALKDEEERKPLTKKYNLEGSPAVMYYEKGVQTDKIQWTPETTDKTTGILADDLDTFFKKIGMFEETAKEEPKEEVKEEPKKTETPKEETPKTANVQGTVIVNEKYKTITMFTPQQVALMSGKQISDVQGIADELGKPATWMRAGYDTATANLIASSATSYRASIVQKISNMQYGKSLKVIYISKPNFSKVEFGLGN